MKILVIQRLSDSALAILDQNPSVQYEVVEDCTDPTLLGKIAVADAVTIRDAPISEELIAAARQLKVIARHGVGYDNIPVAACTARKIPVATTGSANIISVAEHALYLLMCAARRGIELDAAVRSGRFSARTQITGLELKGKSALVIGFGRIGREVAERLHRLGLSVCVYDPFLEDCPDHVSPVKDLHEALGGADVASLHVPLSSDTSGMIGAREIALMPRNAIILNTSRGGLIDEKALIEAIRSGHLFGAGLDTFAEEPLPMDSPLLNEKRVVLSPHSAALTEASLRRMGEQTIKNALDGLAGTLDPHSVINPASLRV